MSEDDRDYMCRDIRNYIFKVEDQHEAQHSYKYSARAHAEIRIWSLRRQRIDHTALYERIASLVAWIRSLKWSRMSSRQRIVIQFYATPFRKEICLAPATAAAPRVDIAATTGSTSPPPVVVVLGKCHVNSGQTIGDSRSPTITVQVFRIEDYLKVLIHELLHAFDWDRLVPTDGVRFPAEYESLIECMARILYAQWLSKNTWETILRDEIDHSIHIKDQLMTFRWQTTTNVVAYYFVAVALLANYTDVLRWLDSADSDSALRKKWATMTLLLAIH